MFLNIYIGNLSHNINKDTLTALFSPFGSTENAKVIQDRFSGASKGYGFIDMPDNSEADQAIKALNGKYVEGNHIKVRPADSGSKKRKKKSFRKRGY